MQKFKKINTQSVVQQVTNAITDAIITGDLKLGDRLPSEPEMAAEFGVARSSIREAIKNLAYIGVLETKRAEGTFVSDGFNESMIDPMVYGIFLNESNHYEHLMELRHMIEVGMVHLAIKYKNENSLKKLEDSLYRMEEIVNSPNGKVDFEKLFQADNEFHDTLAMVSKNPLADKINRIVRTLTHSIRVDTVNMMIETDRLCEFSDAHREIYSLIADGNYKNLDEIIMKTYFLDDLGSLDP